MHQWFTCFETTRSRHTCILICFALLTQKKEKETHLHTQPEEANLCSQRSNPWNSFLKETDHGKLGRQTKHASLLISGMREGKRKKNTTTTTTSWREKQYLFEQAIHSHSPASAHGCQAGPLACGNPGLEHGILAWATPPLGWAAKKYAKELIAQEW